LLKGGSSSAADQDAPAAGGEFTPVVTPNGATLPYKLLDGVKVFHLIAEPVKHEMAPGLMIDAWGYNGRTPGPTIEVVEGDRVTAWPD
jgi:FtsP/CotA-like multicopper oxidase with cupredoxin domain